MHHAIILFYKLEKGPLKYDSCRAIFIDHSSAVLFSPGDDYLGFRILVKRGVNDYVRLIKRYTQALEMVVVEVGKEPKHRPFVNKLYKACNEVVKCACRLDIGLTLTPKHLLARIIALDGKRNFRVIDRWSNHE